MAKHDQPSAMSALHIDRAKDASFATGRDDVGVLAHPLGLTAEVRTSAMPGQADRQCVYRSVQQSVPG